MKQSLLARLESHSKWDGDCHVWIGAICGGGYGHIKVNGRMESIHRVAWILTNGAIPPGLYVLHRCDNRPCWNPLHLFLGTQSDNNHDMAAKGRLVRPIGESNGRSKLTVAQVLMIRRLRASKALTQAQVARQFGVNQTLVSKIEHHRLWAHL